MTDTFSWWLWFAIIVFVVLMAIIYMMLFRNNVGPK